MIEPLEEERHPLGGGNAGAFEVHRKVTGGALLRIGLALDGVSDQAQPFLK
jgi:hypothetical protein